MKRKSYLFLMITLIMVIFLTACGTVQGGKGKKGYDYLVLVNKYSKLPDDWENNVQLVDTKNAWDEDIKIEKNAFKNYKKLKEELKKEGITIELDSVYRSVKEQQELWDEWSNDPEKGIEYVKKYVAVPGYSEHHTGLAVDICLKKDGKLINDNDEMIAEKKIFAKIHKKLAKYGFILRYLEGRDSMTGYSYEPWHLRYIDDIKIAKEIMSRGITFEEYLDSVEDIKNVPEAAKYKIEKTLEDYFNNKIYEGKVSDIKFNITKIYSDEDKKKDSNLKGLKIGENDIPFEVEYQMVPGDDVDPESLMVADGEYDKELNVLKNYHRVGVLKYNETDKSYSIKNFGTGW